LLAPVADDVEIYLGAFDKAIEARLLNGLDMHKHIAAAAVRRNKAVALSQIKPLHSPAWHVHPPIAKKSVVARLIRRPGTAQPKTRR
jgi:hypothetical protein